MPSLSALREFKASFDDIGGQKTDLRARGTPLEDFVLPDNEPPPMAQPAAKDDTAEDETAATGTPDSPVTGAGDFDFGAFLGTAPGDIPDVPAEDLAAEEPSEDFNLPKELLADLSTELDAAPPDEDTSETFDLGDLGDFSIDEPAPSDGEAVPADEEEPELIDLEDLGDFGLTAEELGVTDDSGSETQSETEGTTQGETEGETEGETLDLDDLGDFGLTAEELGVTDDSGSETQGETEGTTQGETEGETEGETLDLDDLGDFGLTAEELGTADDSGSETQSETEGGTQGETEGTTLDLDDLGDFGLTDEELGTAGGSEGEPEGETEGGTLDLDDLGDFGLTDEELGTAGGSEGETEGGTQGETEGETLDLDDLGDFGLTDEELGTAGGSEGEPEGETEGGTLDLDDLGDFGLTAEELGTADDSGSETQGETEGETLDLDDLGDFGLSDEPAAADSDESLPGFSPDEVVLADESESLDSFEKFDPQDGAGLDADDIFDDDIGDDLDDFSFPDLDNVKSSGKTRAAPAAAGAKTKPDKRIDSLEEIQISDDELKYLEETLSGYPLNLRIACEEVIAEEEASPEQMLKLIGYLIRGASAKETASYVGGLLDRTITIPKSFQKSSGKALEAEQASFAYIFVHNFLPILRVVLLVAIAAGSLFYLVYRFIYTPLRAESIYKIGYERIFAGEYQRANERFTEAFNIHRRKDWFFRYAEAFRDERQYIYAEQKYDELLRYYPRDKKGVLDYAYLETYYLRNYAKADNLLRQQLLDYAPDDPDGLLAAGDNYLAWGEIDPSKYEDARYAYARLLEKYGWNPPVVERMMRYFIRTDNLKEVLPLRAWFDSSPKRTLSAQTLSELGGYLLDKVLEETKGVPNEYVEHIDNVRDLLLEAIMADPSIPESHYHLARYYQSLGNTHEERVTLEVAIRLFERAREESIQRLVYRIDSHQRYADNLIGAKEFVPAEEQLIKGIGLYEDGISRRLLSRSPRYGRLFAGLGDLEYFTKTGDMEAAIRFYQRAEQNRWAPPEMQYRMGSAYYRLEDWRNALEYLFTASTKLPMNRRILFALGNAALKRGDYFAAQGYYNRLLDILESQRSRLPILLPNDRPEYLELAERLMMARNNAGVAYEMLASQTGNRRYHTQAIAHYAEAERAWDSLTRDPRSMIRSSSTPLPFLNSRNALYPQRAYEPQIFIRIDNEALETSIWESIAPIVWQD